MKIDNALSTRALLGGLAVLFLGTTAPVDAGLDCTGGGCSYGIGCSSNTNDVILTSENCDTGFLCGLQTIRGECIKKLFSVTDNFTIREGLTHVKGEIPEGIVNM